MNNDDDDTQSQENQKKFKNFIQRISYCDDPQSNERKYKYNSQSLQPFLYFYKLLALRPCAKKHKNLVLNIPDTIIFNDTESPIMWFYTNQRGEVAREDNIYSSQIISKLSEGALEKQIIAVSKRPSYDYGTLVGNDVKVINTLQISSYVSTASSHRNQYSVLQRFVKSNSIKPSIVRTCWRNSGKHESWSLNSNYSFTSEEKVPELCKFIVNTKIAKVFRVVKNISEKYISQTLRYTKNIVDFISRYLNVKFSEFVCDFIKDQGGNWWFINVKAFILETQGKISLKPITMHHDVYYEKDKVKKNMQAYTKCKKCKYCNKVVAEHLMTHKLTLMIILQCDQHLVRMGKNFPWLQRCYKQHVSSVNLYVQYKICDSCYLLYKQIQKLMRLQKRLAQLTGIKVKEDNMNLVSITSVPSFKGHSPKFGSRFQKVKYDTEMPKNWGLPLQKQLRIGSQNMEVKMVHRCRFMIFIHGVTDIPRHFVKNGKKYSIKYEFLNQCGKYNLNMSEALEQGQGMKIRMTKIKNIYFFSENRQKIIQFLKIQPKLFFKLYEDNQPIGELGYELDDFKSDKVLKKDFFKMFYGPKIFPFLSWGLSVSLGLHEGPLISTNSIRLISKNSLLFPQHDYHSVDPLPEEWIEMIKDKPNKDMQSSRSERQITIDSSKTKQLSFRHTTGMKSFTKRKVMSQHKLKKTIN